MRLIALLVGFLASHAVAQDVLISPDLPEAIVETPDGGTAVIRREQDTANEISGDWARTSRPCPPFCIQPMSPVAGVRTLGELELIEALQDPDVKVVDSRTPDWFRGGTIPGAVSIPWDQMLDRLDELGCAPDFEGWDCEGAGEVVLFCNGLWCGQSPTAIRYMVEAGYPVERIGYYRGGMQTWRMLGLTVTDPS